MAPSGFNCAKRKSGPVSSFEAFSRIPGLLNSFDGHESPSCMKLNNTYNLSFNFSTNNYGGQYWNYFFSLFRYKLVLFEFMQTIYTYLGSAEPNWSGNCTCTVRHQFVQDCVRFRCASLAVVYFIYLRSCCGCLLLLLPERARAGATLLACFIRAGESS